MTFPATRIPSQLRPGEFERLFKLLAMHYSYPLPYPLSGAYFEELFAKAVKGVRETRKLLFDVTSGNVGWSLKTVQWSVSASQSDASFNDEDMEETEVPEVPDEPEEAVARGDIFEVVVMRCDILRDRSLNLDAPVETLGERVIERFNEFCNRSARLQGIQDPRAGFLVRNAAQTDFVFFQRRYQLYEPLQVQWQWANADRKSLKGFIDGTLVLRWYRSGTQLFGVNRIPQDAHRFTISSKRVGVEQMLSFFQSQGAFQAKVAFE